MSHNRGILVVEDEPAIADLVAFHLQQEGYEPVVVAEGKRALSLLEKTLPAAVVLDLMLPDIDGIEILRKIRQETRTRLLPVLILTARGEEADRILGLETGADDYLAKPFSPRELLLRLEKLIHGRGADATLPIFKSGIVTVDESRFSVTVAGTPIEVSATEMRLLTELIRHSGKVLSRDQLLQRAWGFMPNVTTRTIDTHIKRLRQKLGEASDYIETIRGVGYRWIEPLEPSLPPSVEKESSMTGKPTHPSQPAKKETRKRRRGASEK
jgi:two-component system phosphate regulon response regulator PhoB